MTWSDVISTAPLSVVVGGGVCFKCRLWEIGTLAVGTRLSNEQNIHTVVLWQP